MKRIAWIASAAVFGVSVLQIDSMKILPTVTACIGAAGLFICLCLDWDRIVRSTE